MSGPARMMMVWIVQQQVDCSRTTFAQYLKGNPVDPSTQLIVGRDTPTISGGTGSQRRSDPGHQFRSSKRIGYQHARLYRNGLERLLRLLELFGHIQRGNGYYVVWCHRPM